MTSPIILNHDIFNSPSEITAIVANKEVLKPAINQLFTNQMVQMTSNLL